VIELDLLTHLGLHAAHPGKKLCILDVQFDIHRKLADMASGAQEIGAEKRAGPNVRREMISGSGQRQRRVLDQTEFWYDRWAMSLKKLHDCAMFVLNSNNALDISAD